MSSPRPSGARLDPRPGDSQRDASRDKLAQSMGQVRPDDGRVIEQVVAEVRAAGGYVSPSRLRAQAARIRADAGAPTLTYYDRHRRASVPADRLGDRVTAQLAGGQAT